MLNKWKRKKVAGTPHKGGGGGGGGGGPHVPSPIVKQF